MFTNENEIRSGTVYGFRGKCFLILIYYAYQSHQPSWVYSYKRVYAPNTVTRVHASFTNQTITKIKLNLNIPCDVGIESL